MTDIPPRSTRPDGPLGSYWLYTARNWPIIPCAGKVPLTPHGLKDGTTDPTVIRSWLAKYPSANIAVVTGQPGPVALDVDRTKDGASSLAELIKNHGVEVWDTLRFRSGGGGIHLLYAIPSDTVIHNSAGKLGEGLDVRGRGGYLIVPPSRHPSGGLYARDEQSPDDPAPMPASLLARIQETTQSRIAPTTGAEVFETGRRNTSLTSLAGTMRRRGMTVREIAAALHVVNNDRCVPPLDVSGVGRIAASVCRYPPQSSNEAVNRTFEGVNLRVWTSRHD
jgi:Bifunctional DNA primase/polymerase, N-terminal/Primase C terminal 1 (PriCT-1)